MMRLSHALFYDILLLMIIRVIPDLDSWIRTFGLEARAPLIPAELFCLIFFLFFLRFVTFLIRRGCCAVIADLHSRHKGVNGGALLAITSHVISS
jgi:hypothetical protein